MASIQRMAVEALKSVKSFWTSKRKRTQDEISSSTDESGEKMPPAEELSNKAKRQRVGDVSEKRPYDMEANDDIKGKTNRSDTQDESIDLNNGGTKPSPKPNDKQVRKSRRKSKRLNSPDKSSKEVKSKSSANKAQKKLGGKIQIKGEGNSVDPLNGEKSPNSKALVGNPKDSIEQEPMLIDVTGIAMQEPILSTSKVSKSKYKGVTYHKRKKKKWEAHIRINGKSYFIGNYDDELEAGVDYARAVYKYHIVENVQKKAADAPDETPEKQAATTVPDKEETAAVPNKEDPMSVPSSKHEGVTFNKKMKKWQAFTWFEGQKHDIIGWFDSEDDAAEAIEHFHS